MRNSSRLKGKINKFSKVMKKIFLSSGFIWGIIVFI